MSITFQIKATTTRLTTYGMKKRLRQRPINGIFCLTSNASPKPVA
jgi:hypothetical protein